MRPHQTPCIHTCDFSGHLYILYRLSRSSFHFTDEVEPINLAGLGSCIRCCGCRTPRTSLPSAVQIRYTFFISVGDSAITLFGPDRPHSMVSYPLAGEGRPDNRSSRGLTQHLELMAITILLPSNRIWRLQCTVTSSQR